MQENDKIIIWKVTASVLCALIVMTLLFNNSNLLEKKVLVGTVELPQSYYDSLNNLIQEKKIKQFVICDVELNKCQIIIAK
jgi:hypothetical protein